MAETMFARKRERMEAEARDAETAKRIAALRDEGYHLWVDGGARLMQSMMTLIPVIVLIAIGFYLRYQFPASGIIVNLVVWFAIFTCLVSFGLYVSSLRLRWKAENIDIEMRRLNPEARLLSSVPEEIGLSIRAALDKHSH